MSKATSFVALLSLTLGSGVALAETAPKPTAIHCKAMGKKGDDAMIAEADGANAKACLKTLKEHVSTAKCDGTMKSFAFRSAIGDKKPANASVACKNYKAAAKAPKPATK